MIINTPTYTVEWISGSHTANYYNKRDGANFDCFNFAFEKDHPNAMDFWNAYYTREFEI